MRLRCASLGAHELNHDLLISIFLLLHFLFVFIGQINELLFLDLILFVNVLKLFFEALLL